ncbi:unnamed protein product [Paramecium octaurelia]|uniref:H-type lectin domain-containing protein n=1 Tax=Paramecium octaurelia TaxID=43137 RepID=A0A8S1SCK8_PAROT|nr:unnamed protein product [Paramecium octaurelia]
MYFQIKIIPIIVNLVSSIIVYDTRVFKGFDNYPIFSCAGTSQTSQIVFSDTFPEIPKIIISLEEIDTNINNSGFILEITDVQLTYFNITISCPYQSVYAIRFKWYAICGGGLQVINYISSGGIVNNTFPHSMSNPKYGFVSLTGFLYNGQIDFLLQVSKLTSSSISVEINQVAGKFPNLLKIGYQVVISQYEIINLGLQYAPQNFISQTIQQICSQWFIFNLQGVNFQNSDNFRLNLTYNNSADIISYEFGKWIGQYTGSYHSQLLFSYQNIYFSCALIKTKMKLISAININDLPEKKIVFIDLNLQYINEGIYNLILNKTLSYMQLEVAMKSFERKFIQSSIHSQENYNHLQSHVIKYKYEKIFNFMTFYLAFTSPNYEQQKLKIIITTGSIELVQVFQNCIQEMTILKFEYIDI